MANLMGFEIIDKQTGFKVGFAKTRAGARRSVDKRDNDYGAYRYSARPVYAEKTVDESLFDAIAAALK